MLELQRVPASYRDSSGFVFVHNNNYYRYLSPEYMDTYRFFMESGLYGTLVQKGLLIEHEEADEIFRERALPGRFLRPRQLTVITYPYEWSFDMWKDAALRTLETAMEALKKGMLLKDATPFNIQFDKGKPVFIDTLSFERYTPGTPWVAYRQYCEGFLAPLLIMKYVAPELGKLFQLYPDGIPLSLVRKMLPRKAFWNLHTYLHIWLQSKISTKYKGGPGREENMSEGRLLTLLNGLKQYTASLNRKREEGASAWRRYYDDCHTEEYYSYKKERVLQTLQSLKPSSLLDLGCNTGQFSLLLQEQDCRIIALDADHSCVNDLYRRIQQHQIRNITPVLSAINHPTPAIGWSGEERSGLTERIKSDVVIALALIHHLAISGNLPFQKIASWLAKISQHLVIEFVPKEDEKVKLLLQNRRDIFGDYTAAAFLREFEAYFTLVDRHPLRGSIRELFIFKRHDKIPG
ncbi:class I SAM-dependent methyltransferase [Niabella aurantiaca]|uniref:class I SAM-dependent methyltransferase n=1 Tax=Niabella aurantiaca TaxID=379900 RepID=UPI00036D1AC8|nr:methyltransferase domain-containing protein [Niabella aurantiaca]